MVFSHHLLYTPVRAFFKLFPQIGQQLNYGPTNEHSTPVISLVEYGRLFNQPLR